MNPNLLKGLVTDFDLVTENLKQRSEATQYTHETEVTAVRKSSYPSHLLVLLRFLILCELAFNITEVLC